jgi:hypothetical protein
MIKPKSHLMEMKFSFADMKQERKYVQKNEKPKNHIFQF